MLACTAALFAWWLQLGAPFLVAVPLLATTLYLPWLLVGSYGIVALLAPTPRRGPSVEATGVAWRPGLVAVLLATLPSWTPILRADIDFWSLLDWREHLAKGFYFRQLIEDGNWLPRWVAQQYGGYGYPTFNYYAPLTYYLNLAITWLMPPAGVYVAQQLLMAAAAVTLIGGAYALGYRLYQHAPAAAVMAAAVAYAPYYPSSVGLGHSFLSGSPPHVLGLGLMAWLLVHTHGLWVHSGQGDAHWPASWWGVVAITALLLLTHNVSAVIAAAITATWVACLWAWRPTKRALRRALAAAAVGGALAAFFWLPALLEQSLVQVERMQQGALDYHYWFLTGFPFDLHLISAQSRARLPKITLWQAAILSGTVLRLVLLVRWLHQRLPAGARVRERELALFTAYGAALALVCYGSSFTWALWWWERFAVLRAIQFPSRLLDGVGFGVAIAGGGLMAAWLRPGRLAWAAALAALIALAVVGTAGRHLPLAPTLSRAVDEQMVIGLEQAEPGYTASTGEFLPRTADYSKRHEGQVRSFWLYEALFPDASWTGGRLLTWTGEAAIHRVSGGLLWTTAEITAGPEGSTLAFHQLAFPGWRAWIDGRQAGTRPAPWLHDQAIQPGFLLVDVPPGDHRVAIRFGPDGVRLAGATISVATALAIAWWLAKRSTGYRRPAAAYALAAALLLATVTLAGAVRLVPPLRPPSAMDPQHVIMVANLADLAASGRAQVSSPSGSTLGPDRFVDVRSLSIQAFDRPLRDVGPRARRWLFMHPPSQVVAELTLPSDAYFQASLALDPSVWDAPLGAGARFRAVVTAEGDAEQVVLDEVVNPRARGEQRRWLDVAVDLRRWAGRRIRLSLRTDTWGDPSYAWAGWGEPAIVRLDAVTASRLLESTARTRRVALRP